MDKFWMVLVDGKSGPTVRHPHKTEAVAEAGRLFNTERRRAYVLEVVGHHDIVASVFTDYTKPPLKAASDEILNYPTLTDNEKAWAKIPRFFDEAVTTVQRRTNCALRLAIGACEFYREHPNHLIWQMHGRICRDQKRYHIPNGWVNIFREIFLCKR